MPGLTIDSVRGEIISALGGDQVEVELSSSSLSHILKSTLRKLNLYRPAYGVAALAITPTQKKYGPIVQPGLLGVAHVSFVRSDMAGLSSDMTGLFSQNQTFTFGSSSFGEIANQIGYMEEVSEVIGSNPEWEGVWEGASFYLYIDIKTPSYACCYWYTRGLEYSDHATNGIPAIMQVDEDWFIEYSIAKAKTILGRVLRKHGGIPNPEGGQDATDGSELVSEGKDDMRDLEEAMKKRRRPLMPVLG